MALLTTPSYNGSVKFQWTRFSFFQYWNYLLNSNNFFGFLSVVILYGLWSVNSWHWDPTESSLRCITPLQYSIELIILNKSLHYSFLHCLALLLKLTLLSLLQYSAEFMFLFFCFNTVLQDNTFWNSIIGSKVRC